MFTHGVVEQLTMQHYSKLSERIVFLTSMMYLEAEALIGLYMFVLHERFCVVSPARKRQR